MVLISKVKSILICCAVVFSIVNRLNSQTVKTDNFCGQNAILTSQLKSKDFNVAEKKFNEIVNSRIFENQTKSFTNNDEYLIPVVVHVIHNGEILGQGTNISYDQILSQIDALNAAFSNYSGALNYYQANVASQYDNPARRGINGVDTKIRFCLASNLNAISTNGIHNQNEIGVIRYNNATLSRHELSENGQIDLMNLTHQNQNMLDPKHYLNIWVVTSIRGEGSALNSGDIPGIQGYSPIPVDMPYVYSGWPLRGVVIRSDVFGDNSVNNNNFVLQPSLNATIGGSTFFNASQGKILVHEVGHAFGLYHTFHTYTQTTNSPCDLTGGDLLLDTPPSDISGLPTYTGLGTRNTCHTDVPDIDDMVENYMYYSSDNVLNTFTLNQSERLHATLDLIYPNLSTPQNCIETGVLGSNGCLNSILTASFTVPDNICLSDTVNVNSLSSPINQAIWWSWAISPAGTILNQSTFSPSFIFPSTGSYSISLTVEDSNGITKSETKNIAVSSCNIESCLNHQAHMILGRGTHLDFSSGAAVAQNDVFTNVSPAYYTLEANFTMSDTLGNLIFYTDGNLIYNSQHQVINANNPLGGSTSVHQIIGTKMPGSETKYCLIIPPSQEEFGTFFRYFILDFANSGLVIQGPYSIQGVGAGWFGEGVTLIPHCNGRDYWMLNIQQHSLSDSYLNVYYLSESGLSFHSTSILNGASVIGRNRILANRNSDKILFEIQGSIKIMNFSNLSGVASDERDIFYNFNYDFGDYYSACFTAGGDKVVFRNYLDYSIWDVSGNNCNLMVPNFYTGTLLYTDHFLAPDDKIYFKEDGNWCILNVGNLTYSGAAYNILGTFSNCDSQPVVSSGVLNLNVSNTFCGNAAPFQSIAIANPNFVNSCKPEQQAFDFDLTKTSCNDVQLILEGCYNQYSVSIDWGDGTPNQIGLFTAFSNGLQHNYQNGTYTITVVYSISGNLGTTNYTVTKTVTFGNSFQGISGMNEICELGQPVQYSTNLNTTSLYEWQVTGAGNSFTSPSSGLGINSTWINWISSGQVILTIHDGQCDMNDTLNVNVKNCDSAYCNLQAKACLNVIQPQDICYAALFNCSTGSYNSVQWTVNELNGPIVFTSTNSNTGFTPPHGGYYTICIKIFDSINPTCFKEKCSTVLLQCPQSAGCVVHPNFEFYPHGCELQSTSYVTNGQINNQIWEIYNQSGILVATYNSSQVSLSNLPSDTYQVCLTVEAVNSNGLICTNQYCETVISDCGTINQNCTINSDFNFSVNGCEVQLFDNSQLFNVSNATYEWTITNDQGVNVSSQVIGNLFDPNALLSFSSLPIPSTYSICLIVNGNNGLCSSMICKKVNVENCVQIPCSISPNFTYQVNGCDVQFSNTSVLSNVTNATYEWVITNSQGINVSSQIIGNLTDPNALLSFSNLPNLATYSVCLIIHGNNGNCSNMICKKVIIKECHSNPCSILADYSYAIDLCDVQLVNQSVLSNVSSVNYNWTVFDDFGVDVTNLVTGNLNSSSTLLSFTSLPMPGVYTVCLTVTGNNGLCIEQVCKKINFQACNASPCFLNAQFLPVVTGCFVQITNQSTILNANNVIYNWTVFDYLGNNVTNLISGVSNSANPNLNFSNVPIGLYSVCLNIVSNNGLCESSICKKIKIKTCLVGQKNELLIEIVPNPAVERTMIKWTDLNVNSVVLTDQLSSKIFSIENLDNKNEVELDLNYLISGMYMVLLYTEQNVLVKKLSVVK